MNLEAMNYLASVVKEGPVRLSAVIEYDPASQTRVPWFKAELLYTYQPDSSSLCSLWEEAEGRSPMNAVNRLLHKLQMTSVEQYIRRKEGGHV